MSKITIVQGGQYGSEGKGGVAAELCRRNKVDYVIRTGAVNAGHTVYYGCKPYKMQQIPTGWVNRETNLVIGPGAYINPDILTREIDMIDEAVGDRGSTAMRLYIDYRAGVHNLDHTRLSKESGRHYAIGATGKGCSEAIVSKIQGRGRGYVNFSRAYPQICSRLIVTDTEHMLNKAYDEGARLLIEATQGDGLDILTGPYPFTTHKSTSCGNWLAECGLSPNLEYDICLVLRTMPIRVAGNSGPLLYETTWLTLLRDWNERRSIYHLPPLVSKGAINALTEAIFAAADSLHVPTDVSAWTASDREANKAALSDFHLVVWAHLPDEFKPELERYIEMTTVTKKVRRIARFNMNQARDAIRRNRPNYIALTFLNYWMPELWNETTLHAEAVRRVHQLAGELKTPIHYVSTGAEPHYFLDMI